jgi:hypothetical protein
VWNEIKQSQADRMAIALLYKEMAKKHGKMTVSL